MSSFKGDFLGFTYNNRHSSDFGIVRISNGSRFDENLLPTIQDKTAQIPGRDGTYFFGSYYTQRQFSIPFAFDGMTEEQLRDLRTHLSDKQVHSLVFDEAPYKAYQAKVTGTATLKHVPFFDEKSGERIYKGEGTIQFTCYQPYAVCKKKWLENYVTQVSFDGVNEVYQPNKYYYYKKEEGKLQGQFVLSTSESPTEGTNYYRADSNILEWVAASRMLHVQGRYDTVIEYDEQEDLFIETYNPGDIPAPLQMVLTPEEGQTSIPSGEISFEQTEYFRWNEMQVYEGDKYVVIDTQTNLIEGYDDKDKKTGTVYNEYIESGTFLFVPCGANKMTVSLPVGFGYGPRYNYYYI